MSDLKKYIDRRKKTDKEFAEGFEEGYEQFKIGIALRQAKESAGLTIPSLHKRGTSACPEASRIALEIKS